LTLVSYLLSFIQHTEGSKAAGLISILFTSHHWRITWFPVRTWHHNLHKYWSSVSYRCLFVFVSWWFDVQLQIFNEYRGYSVRKQVQLYIVKNIEMREEYDKSGKDYWLPL